MAAKVGQRRNAVGVTALRRPQIPLPSSGRSFQGTRATNACGVANASRLPRTGSIL